MNRPSDDWLCNRWDHWDHDDKFPKSKIYYDEQYRKLRRMNEDERTEIDKEDNKTFTHYAHTANFWALGNGVTDATESLSLAGGPSMDKYGYEVAEFNRPVTPNEINVDKVDGNLRVKNGIKAKSVFKIVKSPAEREDPDPSSEGEA